MENLQIHALKHISKRIVVMYVGRIVEMSSKHQLYKNPLHPYTQSMLKAIPDTKPVKHGFTAISGEIPSPENPPAGCYFHPRCPHVMDICRKEYPDMKNMGEIEAACHLY